VFNIFISTFILIAFTMSGVLKKFYRIVNYTLYY
jgi:hypothetical protein